MAKDDNLPKGDRPLYTLVMLARRLSVSEAYARTLVREGRLPTIRFTDKHGAHIRIDPTDVDAFIEEHKSPAPHQGDQQWTEGLPRTR